MSLNNNGRTKDGVLIYVSRGFKKQRDLVAASLGVDKVVATDLMGQKYVNDNDMFSGDVFKFNGKRRNGGEGF
jgi:hypothetical protein